jgi:hypothetical protein
MKNPKRLIVSTLCVLMILGGAGYWWLRPSLGVPGELYRYYPENTGFYVELAPGEKLSRRFVSYLDQQAALEDQEAEAQEKAAQQAEAEQKASPETATKPVNSNPKTEEKMTPPAASTKPAAKMTTQSSQTANESEMATSKQVSGAETNPADAKKIELTEAEKTEQAMALAAEKALKEQEKKQKRFRRAFLQKFNSTFEPYFSLGVWPDELPTPTSSGNILVVFPLRNNLSLTQIVQRFDMDPGDFNTLQVGKTRYFVEKNSGTSLAIQNQKLLITSTEIGMRHTLEKQARHAKNVFDIPATKALLAKLPWFRQGTFVLNNSVYLSPALEKAAGNLLQNGTLISQVLPLTTGAIQAQSGNVVTVRTLTPIYLSKISDIRFQNDLKAAYANPIPYNDLNLLPDNIGTMVEIAHLDKLYDFYSAHAMPPAMSRWLQLANYFLASFHVNVRGDLISLLENQTTFASPMGKPSFPILLMEKNEKKDKILDKLSTLLSTDAFPLHQKREQVGDLSVRTMQLPAGVPVPGGKISYGTIGQSIVFASPVDFLNTMRVNENHQKKLLDTPLYQSVMTGLPQESNLTLFFNIKDQPNLREAAVTPGNLAQWMEGIGLALWVSPFQSKNTDLLNSQFNIKIAPPKS